MDPIPSDERQGVLQLLNNLKDSLDTKGLGLDGEDMESFALRFLRARDLNINKAEDMLRKHLEWRRDNDIEGIFEWVPPPLLEDEYPYEITGVDKEGCPILVVPFGIWDVRAVCELGIKSAYIRYVDQLFFRVLKAMKNSQDKLERRVDQFNIIFVPDGLAAFRQIASTQAIDAVLETVKRFEANHPETLKKAVCVDTPKVFQLIFSVIRPLLHSKTLGKVTIAAGSKEWLPVLSTIGEPHTLPQRLGGTYTSKFPVLNKTRVKTPPSIHGELSSSFFSYTIPPGKRLSVEYDITTPKSLLRWSFQTEKWDVGFSILYEDTESLINCDRVNSHEELQTGSVMCEREGKYVLKFDNSFSRWRSKTVRYRVVLLNEGNNNPNNRPFGGDDSSSSDDNDQEETLRMGELTTGLHIATDAHTLEASAEGQGFADDECYSMELGPGRTALL